MKKTIASVTIALAASVSFAQDFDYTDAEEQQMIAAPGFVNPFSSTHELVEGQEPKCPKASSVIKNVEKGTYTCVSNPGAFGAAVL